MTKEIKEKKIIEKQEIQREVVENIDLSEEELKAQRPKKAYIYAVGRRKTSTAQVKLYKKGAGEIKINGKEFEKYFTYFVQQSVITSPLKIVGQRDKLNIVAKVIGGGRQSQSEAIRHGVSRALLEINPNFRKPLKKNGYLTRDARVKERKKPGLKRARRAPQWQKR